MTPPGQGSLTATFLCITVGPSMMPSSETGFDRARAAPRDSMNCASSGTLVPPQGDVMPPLGVVMPFSLSATFLCITGGSRRGKTSLRKGCAFWAWMMMPSSSETGLMGCASSGTLVPRPGALVPLPGAMSDVSGTLRTFRIRTVSVAT